MNFSAIVKDGYFEAPKIEPDGLYDFEARKVGKRRSNPANRYYWGEVLKTVAFCLSTFHRNAPVGIKSAHEFCKFQFSNERYINQKGETIIIPASTRKMSPKEFQNYLQQIKYYLWEQYGVQIESKE